MKVELRFRSESDARKYWKAKAEGAPTDGLVIPRLVTGPDGIARLNPEWVKAPYWEDGK